MTTGFTFEMLKLETPSFLCSFVSVVFVCEVSKCLCV